MKSLIQPKERGIERRGDGERGDSRPESERETRATAMNRVDGEYNELSGSNAFNEFKYELVPCN